MRTILITLLCAASLWGAGRLSNRRAPSFSLPDSRGKQHDILDFRGKVLLLDFMKTQCPHCAELTDVLGKIKQKYGERVEILSIVTFPQDSPQSVSIYINNHRMTTPVLFDCGSTAGAYLGGSFDTPHVFLVDAKGTIRNDFDPTADAAAFSLPGLSAELDKLLGASTGAKK